MTMFISQSLHTTSKMVVLWKTLCLVPVPEKTTPSGSGLNDFRSRYGYIRTNTGEHSCQLELDCTINHLWPASTEIEHQ